MSFKTHIISTCPHPPSTGLCICIWFFQQLHSAIEQNKQKCLFHFPVLEKRPYFPYSLTLIRFAFYFGTTPLIANLLSGGSRRGAPPSLIFRPNWGPKGRKKCFWDRPPYLRVWTPALPSPPLSEGLNPTLLLILLKDSYPKKTLSSDTTLWNCPWGCFWEFLVGCVPPSSPNLDSISDKKMSFFTPVFRPGL